MTRAGSAAKVLSRFSAFADGIGDAFALDLVFHLPEGGHDRKQHRPHGCRGVDVATAEVQDAQARASAAEFVGKASMFWVDRPSLSSVVMTRVSPSISASSARSNCGREARAPDTP